MDAATVALITSLIQLAIKQGTLAIRLITKEEALTETEKAEIYAASMAAHEALQKVCAAQLARADELGISDQ